MPVVVVGGGAAGLHAAIRAAETGTPVVLVSRKPLQESSSYWAQGGLAADAALSAGATAFVAHNDLLAIGVVQRLQQRTVRVPEDVSVVGFDDIFAADLCTPRLTTLGGAHADVGRAAVEILLKAAVRGGTAGGPAVRVVLPTELRLRESTGPVALARV